MGWDDVWHLGLMFVVCEWGLLGGCLVGWLVGWVVGVPGSLGWIDVVTRVGIGGLGKKG